MSEGDEIQVLNPNFWFFEVVDQLYIQSENRVPLRGRGRIVKVIPEMGLVHAQFDSKVFLVNNKDFVKLDPLEVLAEAFDG